MSGSDLRAVSGSDLRAVSGSDLRAVSGSDLRAVSGSDLRAVSGSDLLALGRVEFAGSDFVSVLGQTVFVDESIASSIGEGSIVAVFGSFDFDTGGIVGASVVEAGSAGFSADAPSFLTGFVDSVDYSRGLAVVSGMTVDYNALLSNGFAPNVGDMLSVTGRDYAGMGACLWPSPTCSSTKVTGKKKSASLPT